MGVTRLLKDLAVYSIVLFLSLVESYKTRGQDRWETVSGQLFIVIEYYLNRYSILTHTKTHVQLTTALSFPLCGCNPNECKIELIPPLA